MTIPANGWDPTVPAGSRKINLGDNDIREFKAQIQEVVEVDHQLVNGTDADNGKHDRCSFIESADIGSGAEGLPILGAQTIDGKAELVYTDEDDNDIQLTNVGAIMGSTAAELLATVGPVLYPIGTVLTFGVATNPGDASMLDFGTWEAITGKVIVGIDTGTFTPLNATGGVESVDLSHNHSGTTGANTADNASSGSDVDTVLNGTHTHTISSDLSETQSVLQPYIVKYVWERTA